jgi:hypothetical protein
MPKIVVDVDETLWSFSRAFYNSVRRHGYDIPVPKEWHYWSIFWLYIPKKDAFPIFDEIHSHQTNYKPYADARKFLKSLHKMGYEIIIASHRNPKYKDELRKWLDKNKLPYDYIHTSYDKTALFDDPEIKIVVDDRSETLEIALKKGKVALGLVKPWNKKCGAHLNLFETLTDIGNHITNLVH